MSSPMQHLGDLGRFKLYYADASFMKPGIIVWAFNRHWRIIPLRRNSVKRR